MESVFYEFETQKNMDKVDIIKKHMGDDDFYDINGTPLLTKILSAMDEYAQQQVKNDKMKLDETTLIEIQDYIDTLDEKVGLKPETVEDVRKAIDKHRTELKNLHKYVVIKELPDASVGTEVVWDESASAFYYEKGCWVSPHKRNYLSAGQVTQTPEYFCKAEEYPEYYAYKYPVYSREEVLKLLKESFPNKSMSGEYNVSASKELRLFEEKLRNLGKSNAERIMGVR